MRKIIYRKTIVIIIILLGFITGQAQPLHQGNLGLVAYMVHVKMCPENTIIPQLIRLDSLNAADSAKLKPGQKELIAELRKLIETSIRNYNDLKITYDEIIM